MPDYGGTKKVGGGWDPVPLPTPDPRDPAGQARETLAKNKPVTVLEDFVGKLSEPKAQSNALRDAVRQNAIDTIRAKAKE